MMASIKNPEKKYTIKRQSKRKGVLKSSKYSFRKFKKQPERKGVKKSSKEPFRKFYYNDVNR
jgi:hypothetical protein